MKKINDKKRCWQKVQEHQTKFSGWDFSYLVNNYQMEQTPWDYLDIVKSYLKKEMSLLDMGSGGGELLEKFSHPKERITVTEGWLPNYQLLVDRIGKQGAKVVFVKEGEPLIFPDESFDVVTNSHAYFDIKEVKRILKPDGIFITQQVGDLNGLTLASKLIPALRKETFDWHLSIVIKDLEQAGFTSLYANESYPLQTFNNMDAVIYYARTIPWEFPNFSVENNFEELLALEKELKNGKIENRQHRFMIVVKNNKKAY